ncbi:hypothetical protein BBJ28_00026893 [Nothophytophthora sp. Chile5]|nr:hypothetical protein BBJ28_00026893 [Nothophytophthora sp. Chile5]
MAPRNDEPAAEAAPPAAAEAAPPSAATHVNLVFLYKGRVDTCQAVDKTSTAMSLRLLAKQALSLRAHPADIRLFSLRRGDGSWPDEDEALNVEGAELLYPRRIARLFPNLGEEENEVHFRVEVKGGEEDETPGSDESVSDVESCKKAVNDAIKFSNKRRACSETLPCHKFDEETVKNMYRNKKIKQIKYKQREEALPEELMQAIRAQYATVYKALGPFVDKNEAGKRAYINTILFPCVAYVNDHCGFTGNDLLVVDMEVQLLTDGFNATARADYVVSKGDRNMIIVEAKNADITKGTLQTKATMEAARVANKQLERDWRTIRAICTDMQNWTFLERQSGVVRYESKYNGVEQDSPEFPEQLWRMVRKLYAMLLDL